MGTHTPKRLAFAFAASLAAAALLCPPTPAQSGQKRNADPAPPPPKPLAYGDPVTAKAGRLEGSTYTNDYFGLRLTVPEGWRVADAQGVEQIKERGAEALSGGSPEKLAQASAEAKRIVNLITIGELARDERGASTAMLLIAAEPVASWLITSGRDYNEVVKRQLLGSSAKYVIDESGGSESVGGVEFAVLTSHCESADGTVRQKFYSAVRKGHALFMVSTYLSDKGARDIAEVLKTVKFH
ncbi:MAG TPA: hypothetical protein VF538_03545 [Pyrinomonadaceae bacterium]|jgi:hypothetical protein